MLRNIIDKTTRFLSRLRRNRVIKPDTATVKINIGSGLTVTGDWINLDGSLNAFFARWPIPFLKVLYRLSGAQKWYPEEKYIRILKNHIFIHHNIVFGLPFPDGCVDYVYSSHFLEHLEKGDALRLLKEVFRVLSHGGRGRLCVPDLRHAVSLYLSGKKERALEIFFMPSFSGELSRHRYLYDFEMLADLLKTAGFEKIERCGYQKGKVPEIEFLDNLPDESLYIEFEKT